ncbi:WD40-repeat-containing domain protein [Suillus bovinus]|uniref:WD40-repeat-containing domain protein n=1 Tax=Suillus bovinus TaxID=48563 RepID=UPI001B872D4C|nr:WD40-repeat-containing domain protein [Suillus bovinus]KAG2153033.1 WD40-repeat-containing domain protein [Suillus bovinus]
MRQEIVSAMCWSADSNQLLSGSWDGTARVWDVESGKTVLTIETGHNWVNAVIYSPDATKIATGGDNENAIQIWDTKTGGLLNTLNHDIQVWSLAWTSDGKKLISGSRGPIRIFDTATWEQIAILEPGHTHRVTAISLSQNEHILASASWDKIASLWNLKTNLQVGPPLQHADDVNCAVLSADGKLLVTGCDNRNVYTWDIHAILKEAGLEDLLLPSSDVAAQESLMNADAMQVVDDELLSGFFNDVTGRADPSGTYGNHRRPSSRRPRTVVPSFGSARALFIRLSSLLHRFQHRTNEEIELSQRSGRPIFSRHHPRVIEVAAVKDREVIFTAPPPAKKPQQQSQSDAQGSYTTQLPPGHLVLLLCCASPQHANEYARPMQQQGQAQSRESSSQTEPAAPSTSMSPPAPAASGAWRSGSLIT